jgi:hypothetical protein
VRCLRWRIELGGCRAMVLLPHSARCYLKESMRYLHLWTTWLTYLLQMNLEDRDIDLLGLGLIDAR